MTTAQVRVVIADDQPLVRAGLRTILAADPEIEVVGEAADGLDAITVVRRTSPDLALVDIRMPRLDGLAATRRIVSTTDCRVLVLTTFGQDEAVFDALAAGAHGFLLKDTRPEDLLSAIRSVAAGEGRLDPAVTSIGVRDRVHAVIAAYDAGLVRPEG